MIPLVAASERGAAQTSGAERAAALCFGGVVGPHGPACRTGHAVRNHRSSRTSLERAARAGESPVGERRVTPVWYPSTARHVEPGRKLGRPLSKAKYSRRPIVNEYREGKVKSTPGGE